MKDEVKNYTVTTVAQDSKPPRSKIIEVIKNEKTNRSADIRLDSVHKDFFVVIGDFKCRSKDYYAVYHWAMPQLQAKLPDQVVEWIPVIQLETRTEEEWHSKRDKQKPSVKLEMKAQRFYVALKTKDGDNNEIWVRLEWDQAHPGSASKVESKNMLAASSVWKQPREVGRGFGLSNLTVADIKGQFRLPSKDHDRYYIEYNGDVWRGVVALIKQMRDAAETIEEMFKTKEGHLQLAAIATGNGLMLKSGDK